MKIYMEWWENPKGGGGAGSLWVGDLEVLPKVGDVLWANSETYKVFQVRLSIKDDESASYEVLVTPYDEDHAVSRRWREVDLWGMNMSARLKSYIAQCSVHTVGDLANNIYSGEMSRAPNVGKGSVEEAERLIDRIIKSCE